jgi:hypothetical protein
MEKNLSGVPYEKGGALPVSQSTNGIDNVEETLVSHIGATWAAAPDGTA